MDKETKRRVKILLMGIIGIILLLVGISFATFSADLAGTKIQGLEAGCLKVEMADNGNLELYNKVPETDKSGLSSDPYTYTLTNTCTSDAFYTTTINVLDTSNLDNTSKVKVALGGDSYLVPTIEGNLEQISKVDSSETNISRTYKLDEGYLEAGNSKTFELRTWIDYGVEEITGSLENKIIVLSEARGEQGIYYNTNTAGYQVLKTSDFVTNADYKSIAPSNNQTSGIVKVLVDNDIKYYFRGNPNNYLTFAGKNFRILSTNGDGSVNIVLDDVLTNVTYANINTSLNSFYSTISSMESYIKTDSKYCIENDSEYLSKIKVEKGNPDGKCASNNYMTKVGLLTADDLMFAGASYGKANTAFYLAEENSYYTNSYESSTKVYGYSASDSIVSGALTTANGVKPVITLKSDTLIYGEGTEAKPYYVSGTYNTAIENYSDYDNIAPTITYARVDEKWSNQDKQIEIASKDNTNGSGIAGYLIKTENVKPGATDAGWEASSAEKYMSVNSYDNGTYYVFVKDNNGNISDGTKVVVERVDKVVPTCSIRVNPNGTTAPAKTLTIINEETNIDLEGYSWDHTDSIEDVVKVSENGVYTGYITDLAGNKGSCGVVITTINGANKPVLSDNMIPVYYDETCNSNEGCWEKADSTNTNPTYQWYDYDNKMWANSVTVSTNSNGVRTDLTQAPMGTEIPMDRILTMQVWIPRYKYTIWNYNSDGTATSEPQQIDIEFESGTTTSGEISCTDNIQGTSDGTKNGTQPTTSETCKIKSTSATCTDSTCNGLTYTHPAFTFGDKELTGFWVGKFEVSSDTNCTPADNSAIGSGCNLTTIKPLVKPNVKSWRGAMVSIFENNIMTMNDSSNMYGFASSDDTHMIKNMEWGAVAYLSHSKYGTCKDGKCREININNSDGYYTGRSGGCATADYSTEGTYKYNETKVETTVFTGGTNITPSVTNDTTYPWTETDGLYKSSTQGKDSTTTNLTFNFTAPSDNTYLSFDWSVSSKRAFWDWDYIYYTITKDGTTLSDTGTSTKIGGTGYGITEDALIYQNVSKQLEAGSYTLTFTYKKDSSGASGTDTGYVKNIKIVDSPEVNVEILPIGEGKDGPSASTTGNIYGIYDMSGGAIDYVMGNIVSPNGTTMMSGQRANTSDPNYHSGYSGILYYNDTTSAGYGSYTGTYNYPDNKYYDKYSFNTSNSTRGRSKLGDAIREVLNTSNYGWYSDYSDLAYSDNPWLYRGGYYENGSNAGVFYSYISSGNAYTYISSRLVISQTN